MTVSFEELDSLLQSLEDDRPVVSYALHRAAEGLRGRGPLTVATALEGVREFRARFDALRRRLSPPARETTPGRPTAGAFAEASRDNESLPELRRRLEELWRRERTRRTIAVLRQLHAATPAAVPAVERIRSRVAEWESQLDPSGPAAEDCDLLHWRDDENPALALVQLVRHRDSLSDPEWDACVTLVRGTFGDGVATAVIRGRLILTPESQPATGVAGSWPCGSGGRRDAGGGESSSSCPRPGDGAVQDFDRECVPSTAEFQVQR